MNLLVNYQRETLTPRRRCGNIAIRIIPNVRANLGRH